MPQNYNENVYQGSHIISTDMQNIENDFAVLKSIFSGADSPPNTVVGMSWYDTNNKVQKFRNYNNSTWLCILPLDTTQRIWIYRNDVVSGLVVDTSVVDKVVGIKATSGHYNLTPGNSMASWLTMTHTHGAGSFTVNTRHRNIFPTGAGGRFGQDWWMGWGSTYPDYQGSTTQPVVGISASGGGTSWRPNAAIGTLQKIDT